MLEQTEINLDERVPPRGRRSPIGRKAASDTITFRLREDELSVLSERAAIHGVSVHQYARSLVIEALFRNSEGNAIREAIKLFQDETVRLRDDLTFSIKTLLMTTAEVSEKEA